jgi:hypothetical protein
VLTIRAEAQPGQDIKSAARDAVELATRTGCMVDLKFNDVLCVAMPLGDPRQMVKEFHEALESKRQHRMAFAREPD